MINDASIMMATQRAMPHDYVGIGTPYGTVPFWIMTKDHQAE